MSFLYWFLAIWAGALALPFAFIVLYGMSCWAAWIVTRPFRGGYWELAESFGQWMDRHIPGRK